MKSRVWDYHVEGATSLSGNYLYHVRVGAKGTWFSSSAWRQQNAETLRSINRAGISVSGAAATHALSDAIASVKHFPNLTLVESPGVTGCHFAAANAEMFSPAGTHPATATFEPRLRQRDRSGSLSAWMANVATPLAKSVVGSTLMMAMFAGPLLSLAGHRHNPRMILSIPPGSGEFEFLTAVASVAGGSAVDNGLGYLTSPEALTNHVGEEMFYHADSVMVVPDLHLFGSPDVGKPHAKRVAALFHALRLGKTGRCELSVSRFLLIASSRNRPEDLLFAAPVLIEDALADVVTLQLDGGEQLYGHLPRDVYDLDDFSISLADEARRNYGTAMPAFLTRLVEELMRDPEAVKTQLRHHIKQFCDASEVDPSDRLLFSAAKTFGLIEAAGRLARSFGVLPKSFSPRASVMACFAIYRASRKAPPTFDERLKSLLHDPKTINLDVTALVPMTDQELAAVKAFRKTTKRGVEIWLTSDSLHREFPDWKRIRKTPDCKNRLRQEGDRFDNSGRVRDNKNKRDRVHRFIIG